LLNIGSHLDELRISNCAENPPLAVGTGGVCQRLLSTITTGSTRFGGNEEGSKVTAKVAT
jgi:hypothetical protein